MALMSLFLLSCSTDDDPKIIDPNEDLDNITVGWDTGFPQVVNGASTLDLKVKTKGVSTVYYVITDEAIDSPSANFIKSNAISTDDEIVVKNGLLNISRSEVNDTIIKTIQALESDKTYFTYIALETKNILSDSLIRFMNHLPVRQSVENFHSEEENRTVKYLSYKLEDYYKHPEKSYPLLVFLSGRGETSENGEINMLQNNTLPLFIEQGNDYPFIIVSPQAINERWDSVLVDEMVEEAKSKFRVDEHRIYVAGISAGGFGAWRYAFSYPDKVAAIVSIAGGGDTTLVCAMSKVPVWVFHGDADSIVPVSRSIDMVNALTNCNPAPETAPKLTIYPGVEHDSWKQTLSGSAGHDIYSWLLSHRKE